MPGRRFWATVAGLMLAAIFVAVLIGTIDYQYGTAWDEKLKVRGAMSGRYFYYHPLVMIDLAQGVGFLLRAETIESFIQIGRVLSVLAGGLLVFGTFLLARLVLPDLPALAAAAATAATPLVSVHARLFKEDIFLAAFLVLAFAALIRLLQAPSPHRAILLGILAGFTAGSKYVGFVFLLFALVAIAVVPTPGPPRKPLRAATVSGVAIGTFLLVMLPAIRRIERWHKHVNYEIHHAAQGHDVALPLRLTYGIFHLRESLLPGMGAPLLIVGIVGLAAPFVAAQERRMPLGVAAAAVVMLAALPALLVSVRANTPDVDPRAIVPAIVIADGARVAFDRYSTYSLSGAGRLGGGARKTSEGAEIIVTSNLTYDRVHSYAVPESDDPESLIGYYRGLGRYPYLEVSNGRPRMAYFNPVLRIVAVDGSMQRLREIGKSINEAAPSLKLDYVEGSVPTKPKL